MKNSMKKSWVGTAYLIICTMLISMLTPILNVCAAEQDINILMMIGKNKAYINGEIKQIDGENNRVAPMTKDNTILVPVRLIADAIGAEVGFDNETNQIVVKDSNHYIKIVVNSTKMDVDGNEINLSAPVQTVFDRTMVPIQPFVEGFGKKVFWNKKGVILVGSSQLNPNKEKDFINNTVYNTYGERYWTYDYQKDFVPLEEIRAKLKFPTITKEMVKEKIAEKNTINIHPSLFVTADKIANMKKFVEDKDKFFLPIYENLIKNANNAIVSAKTPTYYLDDANLRVAECHGYAASALPELGFAYQLTGDKKYAKKAAEFLEAFSGFEDWGAPRHFLDAGVVTTDMAIAYDLIYDTLTKQQRETILDAIMQKTLMPGLEGMQKGVFWASGGANWNAVCHTGILLGAYLNYERDPELCANIIATALNDEKEYIKMFEPAGQSEEGQSYFDYGFSFAEVGFETDMNILGTEFGITDTNGLRNAGWFPLRTSGTMAGLAIGDDAEKLTPNSSRLWFARRFNDVPLAKLIFEQIQREKKYDWRTLVFYDPALYDKAINSDNPVMPQLDNYVPGIDLVTFRNNWTTKGNFISIHAGYNFAPHGHPDAGQVDIQAGGIYWAMGSLQHDSYEYPGYFDATKPGYTDTKVPQTVAGRNHFYRTRTEGKTAVVINGDGQPDIRQEQDEQGLAVVEKIVSKPKGAYAIVNLTSPYNRDVTEYRRGIMMNNDRQVMTVQDEIVTKNDSAKVWWLLNTPAQISIQNDGKSAMLEMNGQRMLVTLASPSNGKLKEIPATYLPGEEFPLTKNTPVKTKKLAVELSNVGKVTISVNFIPLTGGQLETDIKPSPVKAMGNWSVEDGSLVETNKPKLDDLKIDGETVNGFQSDFYSYTYMSKLPIDSTEMPKIEAISSNDVSIEQSEGNLIVTVTDKLDSKNKSKYTVIIKKIGNPTQSQQLAINSVTASETPEANHIPAYLIDGNLDSESRWSGNANQWLEFDLGSEKEINYFGMAILKGYERMQIFNVLTSNDKQNWETVYSGKSSGQTEGIELYSLKRSNARYVRVECNGNSVNTWNSIIEIKLFGK